MLPVVDLIDTYSAVALAVGVAVDRSMIGTKSLWQAGMRVEGVEERVVETKTDDSEIEVATTLTMRERSLS